MNKLYLGLLLLLVPYAGQSQLALWASTCDGTSASFTGPSITSIPIDISSDCMVECFGSPTPTEGAIQGDEQFEMTSDDQSFTFGIENTGSDPVQVTELDFEIQRSNTGFNSYTIELYIAGSSITNIFSEVYNGSAQVSRTATINQTLPAGQQAEFVVVVSGYQGDVNEACNTPNNNGTFRFITPEIKGNLLPIELYNFTVDKYEERKVLLRWTTISEHNNAQFEIERKTESDLFRPIGEMEGAGNSDQALDYAFFDNTPAAGTNYYRLKQIDFDGRFSYSPVKRMVFNEYRIPTLFPTIAVDHINLIFPSSEQACLIQIYDLRGKLLQETSSNPLANENTFDASHFPNNQYVVRTVQNNQVNSFRFIKL